MPDEIEHGQVGERADARAYAADIDEWREKHGRHEGERRFFAMFAPEPVRPPEPGSAPVPPDDSADLYGFTIST